MNEEEKPKIPQDPTKKDDGDNDGGHTYGNEPPIEEPKPAKQPDRYEV